MSAQHTAGALDLNGFAPMLGMLGLDVDQLAGLFDVDPDAPTLDDVLGRLDAIETQLVAIAGAVGALAPVLALAQAVEHNRDKLARFGLKFP